MSLKRKDFVKTSLSENLSDLYDFHSFFSIKKNSVLISFEIYKRNLQPPPTPRHHFKHPLIHVWVLPKLLHI